MKNNKETRNWPSWDLKDIIFEEEKGIRIGWIVFSWGRRIDVGKCMFTYE